MAMKFEMELDTILEAYKRGRDEGFDEGLRTGEEETQRRIVARLRRFRSERVSAHDVGGPVLDEAIERCSATVEAVTPEGAR